MFIVVVPGQESKLGFSCPYSKVACGTLDGQRYIGLFITLDSELIGIFRTQKWNRISQVLKLNPR